MSRLDAAWCREGRLAFRKKERAPKIGFRVERIGSRCKLPAMLCSGGRAVMLAMMCSMPAQALAQAPEARPFVWHRQAGAEQCASEAELRQLVSTALGRDPFLDSTAPRVRGTASREGDEYVARLWLREQSGGTEVVREIRAPASDCAALSRAIVLALSLSLEPVRSPPARPTASRAAPADGAALDRGAATSRKAIGPWSLLGGVEWSLGLLPQPTTGVGMALHRAFGQRVSAAIGGEWLPQASLKGQFSVGLSAARVGACVLPVRSNQWAIAGCAYARGGALNVKDEAGTTGEAGSHPWFAAAVAGSGRALLTDRFVAEAGAGTTIALRRPTFQTQTCPLVGFQEPVLTLVVFFSGGVIF